MGVPTRQVPALQRHKASGQAVVRLGHRDVYLGPFGSAEAEQKYRRLVAEWLARGGGEVPAVVLVQHVIDGYWQHAEIYYRKNGRATSELSVLKIAMRHLAELYADLPAPMVSPKAAEADRRQARRAARGTKLWPSHSNRR